MPTEKFFNLKEGKRQAILEAAGEELMETPYALLTVSRIIQRAGISRASFYYYFSDKEDLFVHLVEEMKNRFIQDLQEALRECGGNFAKGFKRMVSMVLENEGFQKNCSLYQKMAEDADCHSQAAFYEEKHLKEFAAACGGLLDQEAYPGLDDEKNASLLELGVLVVAKTMFLKFVGGEDPEYLKEIAFCQLEMLERGARNLSVKEGGAS